MLNIVQATNNHMNGASISIQLEYCNISKQTKSTNIVSKVIKTIIKEDG